MIGDKEVTLKKPEQTKPKIIEDKQNNMSEIKFINNNKDTPVHIFLSSGVRLDCIIVGYDDVCLITTQKNDSKKKQLLFKCNITSIVEI